MFKRYICIPNDSHVEYVNEVSKLMISFIL